MYSLINVWCHAFDSFIIEILKRCAYSKREYRKKNCFFFSFVKRNLLCLCSIIYTIIIASCIFIYSFISVRRCVCVCVRLVFFSGVMRFCSICLYDYMTWHVSDFWSKSNLNASFFFIKRRHTSGATVLLLLFIHWIFAHRI